MQKFFDILFWIVIVICGAIVVTGNDARFTREVKRFISDISFDVKGFVSNTSLTRDTVTPLDINNIIPKIEEEKQIFPKKAIVNLNVGNGDAGKYTIYWYEAELTDVSDSTEYLATYSIVRLIGSENDNNVGTNLDDFYQKNEKDLNGIKRLGIYSLKINVDGKIIKLRAVGERSPFFENMLIASLTPYDIK